MVRGDVVHQLRVPMLLPQPVVAPSTNDGARALYTSGYITGLLTALAMVKPCVVEYGGDRHGKAPMWFDDLEDSVRVL